MKKFCGAKSEQNRSQKVRRRADQLIANSRNDRADRSDKILRGVIRWRNMAKPDPGRHIFGRVGDQRKKEQCADEKENESEDFVPRV